MVTSSVAVGWNSKLFMMAIDVGVVEGVKSKRCSRCGFGVEGVEGVEETLMMGLQLTLIFGC